MSSCVPLNDFDWGDHGLVVFFLVLQFHFSSVVVLVGFRFPGFWFLYTVVVLSSFFGLFLVVGRAYLLCLVRTCRTSLSIGCPGWRIRLPFGPLVPVSVPVVSISSSTFSSLVRDVLACCCSSEFFNSGFEVNSSSLRLGVSSLVWSLLARLV